MKGGDGANNTVAAHSAFVHAGAQLELAPGEVRPKVVPRGTVDRCTSMVMMTSAAAVRFEHRTLYIKHRTFKPSLRVTVTLKDFGQRPIYGASILVDRTRSKQLSIPAKTGRLSAHLTRSRLFHRLSASLVGRESDISGESCGSFRNWV